MSGGALWDHTQESAAIAMLLRDNGRFLALGLKPQHFTLPKHLAVYEAAAKLSDGGSAVTYETVALELQRSGLDKVVGGQSGLLELRRGAPATVLDPQRLKTLHRLRVVRECLLAGADMALREDLPGALAKVDEAVSLGKGESSVMGLRALVESAIGAAADDMRARSRVVYPGSDSLEEAIGGFRPGGMYVLGALSNVGKSYLVQSWMLRCCSRSMTVGWVSLEDPELTTGSRALGILGGLEPRSIELGSAFKDNEAAIDVGTRRAAEWDGRFLYTDLTGQTELDVCAAMSVMAARGARIVVVDYVGVITASKEQQDRRNEVRWVSIRLKSHAKRLGISLLLISQLTMPRDDVGVAKEPSKYSLRESGDLTNAAEAIVLAWRDNESDDAPVNVKVAKSKSGGVGMAWTVRRDPQTHVFEDTSRAAYRSTEKPARSRGFGA